MEKAILNKHDLVKILSMSESSIMRRVKSGILPKPFKLGENTSDNLWRAKDIQAFIDSKASSTTTS